MSRVGRGSWSFPSSPTRVTDQDLISSSRGKRLLAAAEKVRHFCWCARSVGGLDVNRRFEVEVEEIVRRVNCDCPGPINSIGAMKILCRAAAVLNAHFELFIVTIALNESTNELWL